MLKEILFIYIDWKAINESLFKDNIEYCRYDVIWRPYDVRKNHDFMEYWNESKNFTDQIDASNEFFVLTVIPGKNSSTIDQLLFVCAFEKKK
jgi:hypothetical protein